MLSGIFLGLLLATKLYAWILIPFLGYYWWKEKEWRPAAGALVSFCLTIVPFFLWSPGDFLHDTVFWALGSGPENSFIWLGRPTFYSLLAGVGVIDVSWTWIILPVQLAVFLGLFYFFVRSFRHSLEYSLGFCAVSLLVLFFFSKTFNLNFLFFPWALAVGALWPGFFNNVKV
ncbi:MAG: hypothetical protein HY917_03680 [Candidatus Diapherotrites archaeon]|nr:hypothetical protein [Candidatus Diapherotrites archaeon]